MRERLHRRRRGWGGPSLRWRTAGLVGGAAALILSVLAVALVWTVSDRLHATARREVLRATESVKVGLLRGDPAGDLLMPSPGAPIVRIFSGEFDDGGGISRSTVRMSCPRSPRPFASCAAAL